MSVRKIPKNYRSVTGYFSSVLNKRSIAYESTLERDFFLTLEFDHDVESYEEQPMTINYNLSGKERKYTPDCLVRYKNQTNKNPLLVEIKYSSELEQKWDELKEIYNLIEHYASENNMTFKVFTDKDIRVPYIDNMKFIYNFSRPPNSLDAFKKSIMDRLAAKKRISVKELLNAISKDKFKQVEILPSVWHLVFLKEIKLDIMKKLSNNSILEV